MQACASRNLEPASFPSVQPASAMSSEYCVRKAWMIMSAYLSTVNGAVWSIDSASCIVARRRRVDISNDASRGVAWISSGGPVHLSEPEFTRLDVLSMIWTCDLTAPTNRTD